MYSAGQGCVPIDYRGRCDNGALLLSELALFHGALALLTRYLAERDQKLRIEPVDEHLVRFISTLTDTFRTAEGNDLIHSLKLEGTLSLPDLVIQSIHASAQEQPFESCAASVEPMQRLAGLKIGPGFRNRVIELIGGTRGCSHFLTMALDLAASHTLATYLQMESRAPRRALGVNDGRWIAVGLDIEPRLENACIGLQADAPMMQLACRNRRAQGAGSTPPPGVDLREPSTHLPPPADPS